MSGGSQNTTSQQTIPDWVKPYLTTSLTQGQSDLYNPPKYYPGTQVAPLSGLQTQGLNDIAGIASLPSASSGALDANRFMTSGALLNPDANPYLQQEFKTGANQIQDQIASEFAGAGSNVINSVPIQQQGMADLASQLYGNAYGQGLQAMNQASALAPSIDQGMYLPAESLLSAGGTQQGQAQNEIDAAMQKYNYEQQLPENMLSWYQSLMGGATSPFIGSSSTTRAGAPGGAGALGGAATGAAAGSMLGPWGTAGGALIGGLMGLFNH